MPDNAPGPAPDKAAAAAGPAPVPDFLCIGAQKAGTSWFDTMLRQHRGIFLPPMKEVHFFDFIYVPEHRPWIRTSFDKHVRRHGQRGPALAAYFDRLVAMPRRQDAWYRAIFDHPDAAGRLTGEVTPAYSLLPAAGVERVRAVNPGMKVIFILRDPVDRALSQLRMAANRRKSDRVGSDWLEDGTGLIAAVLARSAYRDNIARWEAVFPPAQILYLPYAGIGRAPVDFLRRVEAFLGVGPGAYSGVADSVHKTRPVEIDAAVVALLEERLQGDRRYLAERFGADYAA
jgi:hypothetical protein